MQRRIFLECRVLKSYNGFQVCQYYASGNKYAKHDNEDDGEGNEFLQNFYFEALVRPHSVITRATLVKLNDPSASCNANGLTGCFNTDFAFL